jgi:hypothetical protein
MVGRVLGDGVQKQKTDQPGNEQADQNGDTLGEGEFDGMLLLIAEDFFKSSVWKNTLYLMSPKRQPAKQKGRSNRRSPFLLRVLPADLRSAALPYCPSLF